MIFTTLCSKLRISKEIASANASLWLACNKTKNLKLGFSASIIQR